MNIINKVTAKTLTKNRTRTLVTIIGIILSAAMFTAVTTFITSLQSYIINSTVYIDGNWEFDADYVPSSTAEAFKTDSRIESLSVSADIGYARSKAYDENSTIEDWLYLSNFIHITGVDDNYFKLKKIELLEGRMPENSSEIIVAEPFSLNADSDEIYNIGEEITLEVGSRLSDGEVLWPNACAENETFEAHGTKQYTVVGKFTSNQNVYMAYTVAAPEDYAASEYSSVLIKAKNPADIYDITADIAGSSYSDYHDMLLMYYGVSGNDTFYTMLYAFAGILIALIMLGSVSLIYNAFAISVSERTKQFGLLKSIGATNNQVRRSVFFEAILLSIIGIPLGLLAGVAGIGVTLKALGGAFASLTSVVSPYNFELSVNVWSLVIAAAIALITVIVSALIPSIRATRITAISAIRQSADIKNPKRQVKVSRLTSKLFGIEGIIASKHFKRNRKRYRATIISLAMSMVLFISATAFCDYIKGSVSGIYETNPADVILMDNKPTLSDESISYYDKIKNTQGSTDSMLTAFITLYAEIDSNNISEDYASMAITDGVYRIQFAVVDDEAFKDYAALCGVNADDYFNADELTGILCRHVTYPDYNENRYKNYDAVTGDISELTLKERCAYNLDEEYNGEKPQPLPEQEVKIGAISEHSVGLKDELFSSTPILIIPSSAYQKFSCNSVIYGENSSDSWQVCYGFMTEDSNKLCEDLKVNADELGRSATIMNIKEEIKISQNLVMIVQVFSYGFIVLISLISIANVFNTISTGIMLRRREFAMLRSVGMTKSGMNKMMNFECLLYGLKAILFGLPISIAFAYLIYVSTNVGWQTSFVLPWAAIGIALLSVFLVVFITMLYSMHKIKRENPIEALKNENI